MTRRLVASYLLVSLVVLLILEIPLAIFYHQLERNSLVTRGERDAVVLASYYRDAELSGRTADLPAIETYARDTGTQVSILNRGGVSLFDTGGTAGRNLSTQPEVRAAIEGKRASGFRDVDTTANGAASPGLIDGEVMYVAVPITTYGEVTGVMRLTMDAGDVNSRVQRFWIGLVVIALLILAALALIGLTVARSAIGPLRRLQASAARFGQGDFHPLEEPDPDAPEEIKELTRSMIAMGRQLEQLIERHRSFVADASHQLRTPLTALRLRLENVEAGLAEEQLRGELEAAIDETVRLSNLVGDLLRLARNEGPPRLTTVELAKLASERVETWEAVAEGRVKLDLVTPRSSVSATCVAVEGAVEQVLDNLLDNALHASPDGGRIRLEVRPGPHLHHLIVTDQGPGLTDDQKERATDRFWRADQDRVGTGLGLAVVAALVDASSAFLRFDDNPDGRGLQVVTSWQAEDMATLSKPA